MSIKKCKSKQMALARSVRQVEGSWAENGIGIFKIVLSTLNSFRSFYFLAMDRMGSESDDQVCNFLLNWSHLLILYIIGPVVCYF